MASSWTGWVFSVAVRCESPDWRSPELLNLSAGGLPMRRERLPCTSLALPPYSTFASGGINPPLSKLANQIRMDSAPRPAPRKVSEYFLFGLCAFAALREMPLLFAGFFHRFSDFRWHRGGWLIRPGAPGTTVELVHFRRNGLPFRSCAQPRVLNMGTSTMILTSEYEIPRTDEEPRTAKAAVRATLSCLAMSEGAGSQSVQF